MRRGDRPERRSFLGRAAVAIAITLAVVAQGLTTPPNIPRAEAQETVGAPQATVPAGEPAQADPLTDADRYSVPVPVDENGVIDPALVDLDPGTGKTVKAILGDEIPVPTESGSDFDSYSPETDVGAHFAVLYPEVVNEQAPDGTWVDVPTDLQPTPEGWELAGESFSVTFPAVLDQSHRVTYTTADGSIASIPTGVTGAVGILEADGVRYPGALPGIDAVYTVAPGGFKETLVVNEPQRSSVLTWDVQLDGFTLSQTEDGRIEISLGGQVVADMPVPTIADSATKPRVTYGTYSLDGSVLSLTIDQTWLSSATYPVFVDPGTATPNLTFDTYAKSSSPSGTFGSTDPLVTGPSTGSGTRYRTFMRFGTSWEQNDRVVWNATLHIKNTSEATPANTVHVDRATWDWGNSLTWNSMIAQPNEGVSGTPFVPDGDGAAGAWWTIEMKKLYQAYSDGTYPDYGFRLTSADTKKFSSVDATGTANDPYMIVSYDTLPNGPNAQSPNDTAKFDSRGGITLSIDNNASQADGQLPGDPDGDEVLVRYQVSATPGQWGCNEATRNYCSAWTDETELDVPSSWLSDGGSYYWRVQSGDVCTQPETLCDMTKPDGSTLQWKDSGARMFTIGLKNWGTDDRYAMWSKDVGNGITLNVNEANGNLFTQVPIDSLATPIGRVKIGLAYNSQAAAEGIDKGLGDGWRLYAGPESAGLRMPIEIEELTPAPYSGVRVRFRSGMAETYGWRALRTYGQVGSGSGVVKENPNGTWTYRGSDGDVFGFDSSGTLTKARPVSTKPKTALAANPNLRYGYNSDGHLISVTDPLDRAITFDWTLVNGTKRLTAIHTWAAGGDWTFDYQSVPRIRTITNPENETVEFLYGTYGPDVMLNPPYLMDQVKNGEAFAQAKIGWKLSYLYDTAPSGAIFDIHRVDTIRPMGASATDVWDFTYGAGPGDYLGSTSLTTKIADPRAPAHTGSGDYETMVDFNDAGLPIRIIAPKANPAADPDYITTMVWNSWGQLVCSRTPAANAVAQTCKASLTQTVNEADELNTVYLYEADEPHRLLSVTHPAAVAGDTKRLQETYAYDSGGGFDGLWVEKFENDSLAGVPDDEALWDSLNRDWGTGSVPGLSATNNFSLRLSGKLKIDGPAPKKYQFRVTGDDGYTLVVGSSVLLNCFYITTPAVNCGQPTPEKKLWAGYRPITIEYREETGSANLKVEWKPEGGVWAVIPPDHLVPDLGLMTRSTSGPKSQANDNLRSEAKYLFTGDAAKMTRLPVSKVTTDLGTAFTKTTDFEYDDYGRRTKTTKFATQAAGTKAITQRFFTGACLTKVIAPEGETTEYSCNAAGDVTQTKLTVAAVTIGAMTWPQQTRIEDTTYDKVGRPTRVEHPGPGVTTYAYDSSGRVKTTKELLAGLGDGGQADEWATTSLTYSDWPTSGGPTMTEMLDDPDDAGPLGRPTTTHEFDWVGNEVKKTDPNTQVWTTEFDAQNRVVKTTTPDPDTSSSSIVPLITTTTYGLTNVAGSVTTTDPAGVTSVTLMDVLGRKTKESTGSIEPTWYVYDAVGNVTRVEQSHGGPGVGTPFSWTENDYNALHKVTALRTPAVVSGSVTTATTVYDYFNDTGRLKSVDGPLANDANHKDVLTYTWDRSGRLSTTTMFTKGGGQTDEDFVTLVRYNDAGEQIRIASDLSADGSKVQIRDYTYTYAGQLDSTIERHGGAMGDVTTTKTYDNGGRLIEVDSPRWTGASDLVFVVDDLGREISRYRNVSGTPTDRIDTSYLQDGSVDTVTRAGQTLDYGYDAIGRTKTLAGPSSTTTWTYQGSGLLGTEAVTGASLSLATTYTYYAGEAGGSRGQLKTVADQVTGGTTTYAYDAAGRVLTRADPGGLTWTRTYEAQSGLPDTQTIKKTGTSRSFEYIDLDHDAAGNLISRIQKLWAGGTLLDPSLPGTLGNTGTGTTTYAYDGAGRMTSATGPKANGTNATWAYGYDGQGNRTSFTGPGPSGATITLNTTTDNQGWPTAIDDPSVSGTEVALTHDEAGSLTSYDDLVTNANDLRFAFDSWGLTSSGTSAGTSASYTLDPLGRITSRTQGAETIAYDYAGGTEDAVRSVATGGSAPGTTTFAFTPGGPLAQSKSGVTQVYLRDLHGDVVGSITPGATTLTSSAWYSAYGERSALTGTAPSLGYQGDLTDPLTGTVDMLTRNYLPMLGRFTSRDVLAGDPNDPPSLNQFVYATGSPVTYSDPTGMCPPTDPDCPGTEGNGDGGIQLDDGDGETEGSDGTATGGTYTSTCSVRCPEDADVYLVAGEPTGTGSGRSDAECNDCSSGIFGFLYQLRDAGLDCINLFDPRCASSVSGVVARTASDTLGGGECQFNHATSHIICTDVTRAWATVPGPAYTLGPTITLDAGARRRPDLMEHEGGHVRQGDWMGAGYVPGYGISAFISWVYSGTNNCNPMEIGAGPGGQYPACHARGMFGG